MVLTNQQEELLEKITSLLELNKTSEYPLNFRTSLEELEEKGYPELLVRQVLKTRFSCYIDEYGVVRRVIDAN